MLGSVVFGLRTWMCTTAAPALAASRAEVAISSGVTGTAGFLGRVSNPPVSAQVMTVLAAMMESSCSGSGGAAVDDDGLARDVGGAGGKEEHGLGDVVGRHEPAQHG